LQTSAESLQKIRNLHNHFLNQFDALPKALHLSAFNDFASQMGELIKAAERTIPREEILIQLSELRTAMSLSTLVHRSQNWPRGYQGDFETIEYVLQNRNTAPPGTIAYAAEEILLNGSVCRQHRNKIIHQANLIKELVRSNTSANILSIACGIAEEVKLTIDELKNSLARVTLVDVDTDALTYSSQRLLSIASKISTIPGNIYKNIQRLDGNYDLILLGGVFDYLNNNFIVAILKKLQTHLNPGGTLFFTNVGTGNPFRIYLEYFSNWILIERSHDDIRNLLQTVSDKNFSYTIETDPSRLTYLVSIKNQTSPGVARFTQEPANSHN
jgi:extracellular factor (EF) 3-hydroxypalmitic acid methyl ester biosynthesis protein